MAKTVAQLEFESDNVIDVEGNSCTDFNKLFSVDARGKLIELLTECSRRGRLNHQGSQTRAPEGKGRSCRKKGDKVILSEFIRYTDLGTQIKAQAHIKRLERLAVAIES